MSPLPLAVMYSFQRKIYNEQDEEEVDRKEEHSVYCRVQAMAGACCDCCSTSERDQNHVLGSLGDDVVEWLLEWCSLVVNYNRHKSKYHTDEALLFILLRHERNDTDEEDSSQHFAALGVLIAAAIVGK